VGRLAAKDVTIELLSAGKSLGTATATFPDTDDPRDVDLALAGSTLPATPSVPGAYPAAAGAEAAQGGPPGPGGAPGAVGQGGPPVSPGTEAQGASDPAANGVAFQASGGQDRRPPVTFPGDTGGSSDGLLFIGFGAGLLGLLGVGWMCSRRREGGRALTAEVNTVPEPGLLAAEFPSLSDGIAAWITEDPASIVSPLLALLADRHRVLVVSRGGAEVRPVHGGPVFRVTGIRPSIVGDVAEALVREGGPPLAVLILLESADGDVLKDYRDLLPPQVGGVVLVGKNVETPIPKVEVASEADGSWTLSHGAHQIRVRAGEHGLERVANA
jgi:hypothetical protein